MAGTEGGAVRQVFDLNSELANFRSYMIEQAPIIRKWNGRIPFATLLMMKQKKRFKTTYAFDSFEQSEETTYVTAVGLGADVAGVAGTFDVSDAEGLLLQAGQLMTNQSIQWLSASGYSKPTNPLTNKGFELGQITAVGDAGSGVAGAGYTLITFKRMHTLKGSGSGTGASTTLWAAGDTISRGNFAAYDSEGTKKPVIVNPVKVRSYCQDFRKAFGVTERDNEEALFVKKDPLQYAQEQSLWNFMYELDRVLTFEGYGMELTVGGLNQTFTHSLNSVITAANRQKITAPTSTALDAVLKTTSQKGKETDYRVIIESANFALTMKSMFQSYLKDEPLNGQKNVGITVPTYTDPLGVKYQLFYSRSVSESIFGAGTAAGAFVANMEYVDLAVFKGRTRSFDLHVDMGKNGQGLQDNDSKKILGQHRFVGGLDINCYDHHQFIYF